MYKSTQLAITYHSVRMGVCVCDLPKLVLKVKNWAHNKYMEEKILAVASCL